MRAVFHAARKEREQDLAAALRAGMAALGDHLEIIGDEQAPCPEADLACVWGVKSAITLRAYWRLGVPTLLFDKPYTRHNRYIRYCLNGIHAPDSVVPARPSDRWARLGISFQRRRHGRSIIFAGSSAKFHRAAGLPEPTCYAQDAVRLIAEFTKRPIIYRPKPSWRDAAPIEGAEMRRKGTLVELLEDAHLLVTWGSSAAVEAIIAGVPVLALGDTIARPVAETRAQRIEDPHFPSDSDRLRWCRDLAYRQWTLDEYASGEAWRDIKAGLAAPVRTAC